jgi:hypothetical protein
MPDTLRVKSWEEFKKLAHTKNPTCVVYVIAQSIPAANHTGLKLILPFSGGQYIFTDTAKGTTMRRTKIPVHTNSKGHHFLTDEDVIRFLKSEINIPNLKVFSYWTA